MCGGEESGTVTYLMAFRTWAGEMYNNILSTSRPGHYTVKNFFDFGLQGNILLYLNKDWDLVC